MPAANVGLFIASGATSRCIGYGVAAIFIILVFFPKLTVALAFMPTCVMGATMICIGFHLMGVGWQLIRMTPLKQIHILTIGFPLLVGFWIEIASPMPVTHSPWHSAMLTSSISVTTLLVFGLYYLLSVSRLAGAVGNFILSIMKPIYSVHRNHVD